ncbi:MAG: hypothetical protein EIB84_04480 [Spiroplasma poulsonii]|uniref:Transmembrane protein n=1 Tax=Spiroplasma poulsonii TaxID=2138 RepID=A0A2P6FEN8_9MOLU|nr:hypothetical protein [Spiroplasma poulsonii]KAF0850279.1 hypothetical protein MSROBK_018290 [Spiroplasma poulsonii]MBW1242086.1 hypothetical protein [Spiroplasma poulsonii]PQM31928.1 hypothetical protein SMSRO_SF017910 [Spiroplasma poulsonii]PWF94393.1 hypothetical protein SMH99_23770 [Spiroplasma poulsonii]PWF96962.1 hypothetical protein SMSE_24090 [Spiroplasma poulsonii]
MNLQNGMSNFNIPRSIHFFFNSSLERVAIFFLASIILFYTILKVVTYFFRIYAIKLRLGVQATKYFFNVILIVTEFIMTIILQMVFIKIYALGNDITTYAVIETVLVFQFMIGIIILMNKQFLNYIFKLMMLIFTSLLFSFLMGKQLLLWLDKIHNHQILVLWLTWSILTGFIVAIFYLFDLKTKFVHEFAFHLLIFLITISNFESRPNDLRVLRHSLLLKILLKLIKILCLLDLFFLMKTVKKTMQNLWKITDNNEIELVELSLLLNALHFFNISQKNGLESLPNKFLKNEINGWMGSLQE